MRYREYEELFPKNGIQIISDFKYSEGVDIFYGEDAATIISRGGEREPIEMSIAMEELTEENAVALLTTYQRLAGALITARQFSTNSGGASVKAFVENLELILQGGSRDWRLVEIEIFPDTLRLTYQELDLKESVYATFRMIPELNLIFELARGENGHASRYRLTAERLAETEGEAELEEDIEETEEEIEGVDPKDLSISLEEDLGYVRRLIGLFYDREDEPYLWVCEYCGI